MAKKSGTIEKMSKEELEEWLDEEPLAKECLKSYSELLSKEFYLTEAEIEEYLEMIFSKHNLRLADNVYKVLNEFVQINAKKTQYDEKKLKQFAKRTLNTVVKVYVDECSVIGTRTMNIFRRLNADLELNPMSVAQKTVVDKLTNDYPEVSLRRYYGLLVALLSEEELKKIGLSVEMRDEKTKEELLASGINMTTAEVRKILESCSSLLVQSKLETTKEVVTFLDKFIKNDTIQDENGKYILNVKQLILDAPSTLMRSADAISENVEFLKKHCQSPNGTLDRKRLTLAIAMTPSLLGGIRVGTIDTFEKNLARTFQSLAAKNGKNISVKESQDLALKACCIENLISISSLDRRQLYKMTNKLPDILMRYYDFDETVEMTQDFHIWQYEPEILQGVLSWGTECYGQDFCKWFKENSSVGIGLETFVESDNYSTRYTKANFSAKISEAEEQACIQSIVQSVAEELGISKQYIEQKINQIIKMIKNKVENQIKRANVRPPKAEQQSEKPRNSKRPAETSSKRIMQDEQGRLIRKGYKHSYIFENGKWVKFNPQTQSEIPQSEKVESVSGKKVESSEKETPVQRVEQKSVVPQKKKEPPKPKVDWLRIFDDDYEEEFERAMSAYDKAMEEYNAQQTAETPQDIHRNRQGEEQSKNNQTISHEDSPKSSSEITMASPKREMVVESIKASIPEFLKELEALPAKFFEKGSESYIELTSGLKEYLEIQIESKESFTTEQLGEKKMVEDNLVENFNAIVDKKRETLARERSEALTSYSTHTRKKIDEIREHHKAFPTDEDKNFKR